VTVQCDIHWSNTRGEEVLSGLQVCKPVSGVTSHWHIKKLCKMHKGMRNIAGCVAWHPSRISLTLSNPIFLPPAYSPALIYFGRERGWWTTCNYPTVLKEKNINRKSTTCAICWLKSLLHEEKRWTGSDNGAGEQTQQKTRRMSSDIGAEQENHVGWCR
jgi:hypothetical protein